MATVDSTKHPDTVWSDERKAICLEGIWELDKIARTLPDLVPLDDSQDHFLVRALAGRMLRLTNMLMDGVEADSCVSNDQMKQIIDFGTGQG